MSTLTRSIALAAMLVVPAISFAQSNNSVTRAQVRADLVNLEAAGYNPANAGGPNYPSDLQAAEMKVAMQAGQANPASSVGGMPGNGTSAGGAPTQKPMNSSCNGPASFCNVYFGS